MPNRRKKKSRKFPSPDPNPSPMLPDPDQPPPPLETLDAAENDPDQAAIDAHDPPVPEEIPLVRVPASRRPPGGGKRRKQLPVGKKRRAEIEEKLALLSGNFRAVPFSPPAERPDFSKHERLFRALGLWEFAHLDLDGDIRSDLLVHLIANYDVPNRKSFVGGTRISVSRPDLARALGLPLKKEKDKAETDPEVLSGEGTAGVVLDFVSKWMVFQDEGILPNEVAKATQTVKGGSPHKVDWAGLIWSLVEKELLDAPKTGTCYYASHLQCLMKHQRPGLFGEVALEPEVEAEPEQEPSMEAAPSEEEEEDVGNYGTARMRSLNEVQDVCFENNGPGLSLGLSAADGDCMDGVEEIGKREEEEEEDGKHDVEEQQQLLVPDSNDSGFEHCLRQCNSSDVRDTLYENSIKDGEDHVEREEDRYENELTENFPSLERLAPTDLLHAMEMGNVSYSPPKHHLDPSSGDFLAMGSDADKNTALNHDPSSSLHFGNGCKRGIGDIDDDSDDGEDGLQHFEQGHQQKRMRGGEPWDNTQFSYDACMEQVQSWMGKAKMLYLEKEQAFTNVQFQLQYLNALLQQKDQIIQSLERMRLEEQRRRDLEYSRFEHELKLMAHLVVGYKKALRETRAAFADYRKQVPKCDELLYMDVPGSGGLVLSVRELQKQRLEKEEEMRLLAVEMVNNFQKEWFAKFNEYADCIAKLASKLVQLVDEVKYLKEKLASSKGPST